MRSAKCCLLGIEENKIGLWACSGQVPSALSVLTQEDSGYLRCAVLCYGYMLDREDTSFVAEAAKQFGFANPSAGKSVNDLLTNKPLFVVRAGQDQMPHLSEALDDFVDGRGFAAGDMIATDGLALAYRRVVADWFVDDVLVAVGDADDDDEIFLFDVSRFELGG